MYTINTSFIPGGASSSMYVYTYFTMCPLHQVILACIVGDVHYSGVFSVLKSIEKQSGLTL